MFYITQRLIKDIIKSSCPDIIFEVSYFFSFFFFSLERCMCPSSSQTIISKSKRCALHGAFLLGTTC
jgi:hypothetical protein